MLALPGDLVIESVTCAFDSVALKQMNIPVTVRVVNSSNTSITVQLLQLIFSENSTGDRNFDYFVTGDLNPDMTIPTGGSADFELFVGVWKDAVTEKNIRIDAYAFGTRFDNLETVSASTSSETVLDLFKAVAFDGNDGSVNWETNWIEEGGEGDGPDEGFVRVIPSPIPEMGLSLAISGTSIGEGIGARREVDLTGAAEARLEFNWIRDPGTGFLNAGVYVQISTDGVAWDDLMLIEDGFDSAPYISSFDITPYISPNTQIRFITVGSGTGSIYLDNIFIDYATKEGAHNWVVLANALTTIIALFDTRMTVDRSDDSLMVMHEGDVFTLDTDYHVASGAPLAAIQFENSSRYRLVIQLHSLSDWDWAPKNQGQGFLSLMDSLQGFGRLSSPQPGIPELLLTETVITDEEEDNVDYVVGATRYANPPIPWNMYTDPWADPEVDGGKLGEYGQLINGYFNPPRWHVDCKDGTKDWELTAKCEKGRYYFHEVWFTPDLDWMHGDSVDVNLMIEGETSHGDIYGLHAHFRMIDDDISGPIITDFTPELVREGDIFSIFCRINDPSGVFDDGSGSGGQGVYLIWDTDGDLENGHNEVQMFLVIDDVFGTDIAIGGFAEGEEIVYAIYAWDDDADTGPADRSLTVSDKQHVTVLGGIAIFDEPYSLWPDFVYPAEVAVPFFIDLTNPTAGGFRLWTSSFIMFTDGADTVTTFLSNETLIDAGVSGFPVRFDNADIPPTFASPDTLDIIVFMEGIYDGSFAYSQEWTASYTNCLIILEPTVHFDAYAVPSTPVNPGDRLVELLRMEVACESVTDIILDSLTVSDVADAAARSAAARSHNIETLYLYRQASPEGMSSILDAASDIRLKGMPGDLSGETGFSSLAGERGMLTDRPLSPSDLLGATVTLDDGSAVFRLESGRLLGAWESTFFYVVADIDSFNAVDGEPLHFGIESPDSISVTGNAAVALLDEPFVSEGTPLIDGFMTFQASFDTALVDTLYSGDDYSNILILDIPSNGNTPDIMSGLSVANYGDVAAGNALETVRLWADNGDGIFSVYSDIYEGNLQYTGDRFEITGLAIPVVGSQRLFVTADIGYGFTTPLELRTGVPLMGIEYVSGNDGPLNGPIIPDSSQVLIRREFILIESLIASSELSPINPGDADVELMAIKLTNYTLGQVTIDSLRVGGAPGLFNCEPLKEIRLHLDDGDGIFDTASDPEMSVCNLSIGSGVFESTGITIAADEQAVLFAAVDLDSMLTRDGDTISVGLMSVDDIYITAVTSGSWDIDGIFPSGNLNPCVTNGMLSHQLTVFNGADSTIAGRREDIQILDLLIPGNGCMNDTLSAISVVNLGTAGDLHVDLMVLWTDDGDGLFDPASDDSIAVLLPTIPQTYVAAGLSVPLDGLSGTRFFASMDLVDGFSSGATIRAGIPQMGIEVLSGNDGPIDRGVFDENTLVIPVPDRVTFFASSMENKRVHAGDGDILNMVIGAYNSYDEPKTLGSIVLLQGGTASTDEILHVRAWIDTDENGLFDPGLDGLLTEVEPAGVLIPLDALDFVIDPLQSSILFITYTLPSYGVRDSVSVDMSIPDASLVEFAENEITVEGDFPLNSAGIDLTDGMIAAQIDQLNVEDVLVSPGDTDIPSISLRIPCNGSESDSLKDFSVVNSGTCLPGVDISNLRLWMESGGTSEAFDQGEEILLDLLVWDGSSWSSISGLSVPIDCSGLTLHVTADFAASAVDGRILRTAVLVNGIEVFSGNDGPIDIEVVSDAELLVTTIPLLVAFDTLPKVTRGQQFDILFGVSNASDTILTTVEPDSFSWSGDGSITQISGPVPSDVDLPGSGSSTFTWSFTADAVGTDVFRARAVARGGSAVSWFELSDTLVIEEIPDFVNVTMDDLSPVSLNRGHRDATLFESMLIYGSSCSDCASVELSSIKVSFMDGQGLPVPVFSIASRAVLEDESMVIFSCDTEDSSGTSLTMIPSQSLILQPGDMRSLRFSLDVSDTASAVDFMARLEVAGDLVLTDVNNDQSVPYGGTVFPWSTNTVTLKDPVTELIVDLMPSLPAAVNRGQEDVEAFDLVLESNGGPFASDISVSSIRFVAMDGGGSITHPGDFLRKLRLEDDLGFGYFTIETFPYPDGILCEFQPELKVSPGMPVTLSAVIDCLDEPVVTGFALALVDSLDVMARDFNSGNPVDILAGASQGSFPMTTDPAFFVDPLSGFAASGSGVLPASMIAGMVDIGVIDFSLQHTGSAGESAAIVSSITIRFLDQTGTGLSPGDRIDVFRVVASDTTTGEVFISTGDTLSSIDIVFAQPITIDSAHSVDFELRCDLSANASPGIFQVMIGAAGFDVSDATDGRSFTGIAGEFPITSGPGEVILTAESVGFSATPMLAANSATGDEVQIFDAHFEFSGTAGGSEVLVESIRFEILDDRGIVTDPAFLVESVRFENGSGELPVYVEMDIASITVDIDDPPAVSESESLEFSIFFGLLREAESSAFSVRITDPMDISCRDAVTGGTVTAEAAGESTFPFVTSRTALLVAATAESFSNYPNPFIPGRQPTTVTFYLPEPATVSLEIYTIFGRLVTRLLGGRKLDAGLHQDIIWDGSNGNGDPAINGVYLLVLTTNSGSGEKVFRRKVSLVR